MESPLMGKSLEKLIPMTPIQQAYWVGRQSGMELGGVSTHSCEEIACHGRDMVRLEETFNRLIQRHDLLRGVVTHDGMIKVLDEVPHYEFRLDEARHLSAIEQYHRIDNLRNRIREEVLASDSWPLFRIKGVRLSESEYRLFVSTDALMLDASSRAVIFKEWRSLYEDDDSALPEQKRTYKEYVHESTTSPDQISKKKSAQDYWDQNIIEMPGNPRLLARKTKPTKDTFDRLEADLPKVVFDAIKERCLGFEQKTSVTSCILALFSRTLSRWSKSHEFHIVLTLFDQLAMEDRYQNLVGDFTNTMLIDCSNHPDERMDELGPRINQRIRESIKHSIYDGVEVIRYANKNRNVMKHEWHPDGVKTVFTSLLGSRQKDEWRSAWIGPLVNMQTQTPQVGLDFQLWPVNGSARITWDYAKSIMDTKVLSEIFREFILDLTRFSEGRDEQGARPTAIPAGSLKKSCTHVMTHRIAWQIQSRPDSLAVSSKKRSLTFRELGEESMGIAEEIRRRGTEGRAPVLLALPRSTHQVTGALGIMLSGSPYVPVSTEWPQERIERIMKSCGADGIVCHDSFLPGLHLETGFRIDPEKTIRSEFDTAKWPVDSDDLAYIIYTSGSTGEPKGVAMQHGATMTTLAEIESRYMIDADDCIMGISAMSFDLSVWDVFGGLGAGAKLVIPDSDEAKDPGAWLKMIEHHEITIWNSVPTLAQLMIERQEMVDEKLPIRLFLLSGDWIPVTLPERLMKGCHKTNVVSLGGATEAAVWSVCHEIGMVDPAWRSIPYGRALAGQTLEIMNEDLQAVEPGVIGEIIIGGHGLSQGYYGDQSLTELKFPTLGDGRRVYRTGDLGRQQTDGVIEFLGRADDQVKVAGHRIELGEIEFAFESHPEITACLAKAVGPPCGERRLFAYVVASSHARANIDLDEIRTHASRTLPDYMIPNTLRVIEELPLSSNGKVDRSFDLEAMQSEWGEDHTTVRGSEPVESRKEGDPSTKTSGVSGDLPRVSEIICEVLGIETIHADESTLDLGASSVDMIRIANRLEQINGGIRPRLDDLYEASTPGNITKILNIPQKDREPKQNPKKVSQNRSSKESVETARVDHVHSIVEIARDILGMKDIEPSTNLLDAGASSVDMIRIANRIEGLNGGIRPRLDDIYEKPTPRDIAALLQSEPAEEQAPTVVETPGIAGPAGLLSVPGANNNPILSKELRTREEVAEFKAARHGRRSDLDGKDGISLLDTVEEIEGIRPRRRKTRRLYSQNSITLEAISELIGSLRADGSTERRFNFGSSGPTYSISTYLVAKQSRIENVDSGSYWYDPDEHKLIPAGGLGEFGPDAVWGEINKNMLTSAAFGIALVYRPAAIWPVYDRASDRYAILEAGFMSQLLEMQAEEQGMGICQVGAMDSEQFIKAVDLPEGDTVINWLVGGIRLESGDDSGFKKNPTREVF
jgi:amino acid adenylation domain-containing protein